MSIAIVSALSNGPLTRSDLIECMTPYIRTNKKQNLFIEVLLLLIHRGIIIQYFTDCDLMLGSCTYELSNKHY